MLIYNSLKKYTSCETNAASRGTEKEESKDKPISTFSILLVFCGFFFRPSYIYEARHTVTLYLEL